MARARIIKPGFFKNEDLLECSMAARLLFAGLWTLADREGRLEDRPKRIKLEIFPGDNVDCDALLNELTAHHFIKRYQIDENKYIEIKTFCAHQNPHKNEVASTIPPEKDGPKPERDVPKSEHSGLNLNPLTLNLNPEKKGAPAAPVFEIPDWIPFEDWNDFMEIRKKLKAAQTVRALNSIVSELGRLRTKGHDPGQVLQQSIRSSWKDVWPIKEKTNGSSKKYTDRDALAEVLADIDEREKQANSPPGAAVLRLPGHLRQDAGPVENLDEHDDPGSSILQPREDQHGIHKLAAAEHENSDSGGYFEPDRAFFETA